MKLMTGTSFIAMTAAERAKGRYMRAPDHPTGGDGDGDGGDGVNSGNDDPEPVGGEINDDVLDEGTPGNRSPGSTEDDSTGGDGDAGEEGTVKETKSVEERIGELTASFRETERKLAERDRDLEYWRGRAEGTINEDGSPVEKPQDAGDRTIPADDPDRPKPEDYQYGETDAAYIRDLARYEARAAFAEERQQAQVAEQLQTVENQHSERVNKAKERYADYDEVVVKGADPDPVTGEAKWACSPLLALGIKTSDFGPDIAYQLASNPEESVRISQLSPLEQAKEFGRLEYKAEMEAKADGRLSEDQGSATTKVTNAPEPPPRTRGAGGKFEASDDTDDFEAFEQKVDSKTKGKKRRL